MAEISYLHQHMRSGSAALDESALETLEVSLGTTRCGQVLADVCLDLMDRVGRFEDELATGTAEEAARVAHTISALAAQVGLTEFSFAAANMSDAIHSADSTAIAAVLERFRRITDNALFAVLEKSSLSGV